MNPDSGAVVPIFVLALLASCAPDPGNWGDYTPPCRTEYLGEVDPTDASSTGFSAEEVVALLDGRESEPVWHSEDDFQSIAGIILSLRLDPEETVRYLSREQTTEGGCGYGFLGEGLELFGVIRLTSTSGGFDVEAPFWMLAGGAGTSDEIWGAMIPYAETIHEMPEDVVDAATDAVVAEGGDPNTASISFTGLGDMDASSYELGVSFETDSGEQVYSLGSFSLLLE